MEFPAITRQQWDRRSHDDLHSVRLLQYQFIAAASGAILFIVFFVLPTQRCQTTPAVWKKEREPGQR
ncbi:hypothetical protein DVDV_1637 [Desulfovibrio sp. DV]|nr:hypothetical protein DVDV_1637 [Desulfovibrio sp. DV]